MLYKKYMLPFMIAAFLFSACTNSPDLLVRNNSGDQSITAKAGKPFTIQMEGQLSTGYSWKLGETPASLTIVKEGVAAGSAKEKDKVGGIDIQEFIFKSMEKGELTLTFKYGRHWMKKPDYIKTTVIKVIVE